MLRLCRGELCQGRVAAAAVAPDADSTQCQAVHRCVDPEAAQRTRAVRHAGFLSAAEIADVHAAARELRETAAKKLGSIQPQGGHFAWQTLFLQSGDGFDERLAWLRAKLRQLALTTSRSEGWGIIEAFEEAEVNLRVVEYHEYTAGGKLIDPEHCDHGSLVTIDLMLADHTAFTGGELCVAEGGREAEAADGGNGEMLPQQFEQGDALVFVSHKRHCVQAVESGRRCVLVAEFWNGLARHCPCRCETNWGTVCPCTSEALDGDAKDDAFWEQMGAVMDVSALGDAIAHIEQEDSDDEEEEQEQEDSQDEEEEEEEEVAVVAVNGDAAAERQEASEGK